MQYFSFEISIIQTWMTAKILWCFPCPKLHLWWNFHENRISGFYPCRLLTDRHTNAGWATT